VPVELSLDDLVQLAQQIGLGPGRRHDLRLRLRSLPAWTCRSA
jgi:hypothetical protein